MKFFGVQRAKELVADGNSADLLLGCNVLAHVPDINDFVGGLKIALKPTGVITFEFPHLLRLIENNQFDTIYHEHFSYFSLLAVEKNLCPPRSYALRRRGIAHPWWLVAHVRTTLGERRTGRRR